MFNVLNRLALKNQSIDFYSQIPYPKEDLKPGATWQVGLPGEGYGPPPSI